MVFQPLAHRNVSDGSDARVAGIIIFQLFFVLILLKRSERTEREECVTCMFLWCPGMFLRGVLKVGDGGLEESANKQVAGGTEVRCQFLCCARPLRHNRCTAQHLFDARESLCMQQKSTHPNLLEDTGQI